MTRAQIPKTINPVQLAKRNEQIQGQLLLSQCERLSTLLQENTGHVDFCLRFMQDDVKRVIVDVTVSTALRLECRRCLQTLTYPVDIAVQLAVVEESEVAETLPDNYEPLLLVDSEVSLVSLIEDEILLSLPVLASHPEGECDVVLPTDTVDSEIDKRKNPFEVLKKFRES